MIPAVKVYRVRTQAADGSAGPAYLVLAPTRKLAVLNLRAEFWGPIVSVSATRKSPADFAGIVNFDLD